jgi:hypothetical protein
MVRIRKTAVRIQTTSSYLGYRPHLYMIMIQTTSLYGYDVGHIIIWLGYSPYHYIVMIQAKSLYGYDIGHIIIWLEYRPVTFTGSLQK